MNATITARTPTSFTIQVEVPDNDSMLDFEEALQERLNDAGVVATDEGLQPFDTDGSPITVGPEYLGQAAAVLHRGHPHTREERLDDVCHRLKHDEGGAEWVLKRLRRPARERPRAKDDEDVTRAITYFANRSGAGRMDYSSRVAANEPIGGGVTEAACKVILKQRLCGSGMKWTEDGAAVVLSLRSSSYPTERWNQSWSKVDRWGFPVAA